MKKKALGIAAVLFGVFSIYLQWQAHQYDATSATTFEPRRLIGSPAPDFKLPALDGNSRHLSDYRGRVVVLDFWATWCVPCTRSMPLVEQLAQKHPDLVVLALNLREPAESVREYVAQHKIAGTVLLDRDGKTGDLYHADAIPMQVLIDPAGTVREVIVGLDPLIIDKLEKPIARMGKTR